VLRARRGHDDVDLTFSDRQIAAPSRGGILVAGNLNQNQKPPPPSTRLKSRGIQSHIPKDISTCILKRGPGICTRSDVSTRLLYIFRESMGSGRTWQLFLLVPFPRYIHVSYRCNAGKVRGTVREERGREEPTSFHPRKAGLPTWI
jgi:hypothetical protein